MTFEGTFDRFLIIGSFLILCAILGFGAITANRAAHMDVTRSNELVYAASRAINNVDAMRFVAKQAALSDPELRDGELMQRFSILRARLLNLSQGELHEIDDEKIQKYVGKLQTILSRIDGIMARPDCDSVCRGTNLLKEIRLVKRELSKLQGRGLVVDGKMRRAVDELNAATIRRIFGSSIAFMIFVGAVALYTTRKNRELHRQKTQLTESQQRLLEVGLYRAQFLAGMSHEFRTPLNAIKGFSQFILMMKAEMPRERMMEYMEDIEKSALDLEETTNSVLDLSKIDAGTFDLYEKTVDLVKIVKDVNKQFEIGHGGERVTLKLPEALPVYCDPTAIKRCVQNLVSNALKFSAEDTEVVVRVAKSSDGLKISVTDSGSGIPAGDLETVWQVYSRSSYTRHSDKQGSGLGLPIIKALIEAHGGEAHLESQIDVGTSVTLTLPAERLRRANAVMPKAA